MIPFNDIDSRLKGIEKTRAWLAEASGRSPDSIRTALAPKAPRSKRSPLLQKALSDAIEGEERERAEAEARKGRIPPGYSAIFLDDEELDRADKASRIARAPSLADFCHDVIQAEARRIIEREANNSVQKSA